MASIRWSSAFYFFFFFFFRLLPWCFLLLSNDIRRSRQRVSTCRSRSRASNAPHLRPSPHVQRPDCLNGLIWIGPAKFNLAHLGVFIIGPGKKILICGPVQIDPFKTSSSWERFVRKLKQNNEFPTRERSAELEMSMNSNPVKWVNRLVSEPNYLLHFLALFTYIPVRCSAANVLSPHRSAHLLHRVIRDIQLLFFFFSCILNW